MVLSLPVSEGAGILSEFWPAGGSGMALKELFLVNNLIFVSFSAPAAGQIANPQLGCEPCFHSTMWGSFKFSGQFPCLLGESTSLQLEVYSFLLFLRSHANWPNHDLLVPVSSQSLQRL